MTVRLTLAYDGTRFAGWALQPGKRTVARELGRALCVVERLAEPPRFVVAGRTDAGVHALRQVVSYDGPVPGRLKSLNAVLPDDITVFSAEPVADGFNARFDALARRYQYRLVARETLSPFERGRAVWWSHRCDLDALQACAAALVGLHDFRAFTPSQTAHRTFTRTVTHAAWTDEGDGVYVFRIEANAFLRNMIRVLIGTMLEAASGRRTVASFIDLLDGAPRELAGRTAPPQGLYFESVVYPS